MTSVSKFQRDVDELDPKFHVFRFVFYVNGFYNNLTKNFFVQHYMISINKLKYVVYACIYGETTVLYLTIIKKKYQIFFDHMLYPIRSSWRTWLHIKIGLLEFSWLSWKLFLVFWTSSKLKNNVKGLFPLLRIYF